MPIKQLPFIMGINGPVKDFRNVLILLNEDLHLQGKIAFNNLYEQEVFINHLPWRNCKDFLNGSSWEDSDTLFLMRYAAERYNLIFTERSIEQAVQMLARENEFCPFLKYLSTVEHKWDGIPRICRAFHVYLGSDLNAYTAEVSAIFFRALIARAFFPGCKFDYVIVLQGPQGIGKSTFLHTIADPWFTDGIRKFEGKEAIEALHGAVIGEISELQGFSKAENEEIKAFITRREDRARPAYGRRVKCYPRRTILVGTTNSDDYLRDATGNRRFLPIECHGSINIEALKKDKDQLFAEVMHEFRRSPELFQKLFLQNSESIQILKTVQERSTIIDPWEPVIKTWLDDNNINRVATRAIIEECLKISIERTNQKISKRVADVMKRMNWQKSNLRFEKYGAARGYIRPGTYDGSVET